MSGFNCDRWRRLWKNIGASGDAGSWFEQLQKRYAESHRRYHNQQHIAECLAEFDSATHLASSPVAVELALWFHDAVYDPKAKDNEERSAALACACLGSAGLEQFGRVVGNLVLATKFHQCDDDRDAALIVDVDLSILGKREDSFFEYETQIRNEYIWVPEDIFRAKRAEILLGFLDRPHIYHTDHFRARYEQNARRNLINSLQSLQQEQEHHRKDV